VATIRTLVQMTGRGVRSADDWAVTYVLDGSFYKVLKDNRGLLPKWWREALDTRTTKRDLGL
jgi:Rad3-related DNA helicase